MLTLAAYQTEGPAQVSNVKLGKGQFERQRRPVTVLFGGATAALILLSTSRWSAAAAMREALFLGGMSLATLGAFGRIWSSVFISGYKSTELVTTGPYSLCRNPLYFFSFVGMTGIGMTTETFSIPVGLILAFSLYYPWIISHEERRLLLRHGVQFGDYCQAIPPFWPRLDRYEEPDRYTIHPRAMRKTLLDAFWFVALASLVHAKAHLDAVGGLPILLKLW